MGSRMRYPQFAAMRRCHVAALLAAALVLGAQAATAECEADGACEADESGLLQSRAAAKSVGGRASLDSEVALGSRASSPEALQERLRARALGPNTVKEFDYDKIGKALVMGSDANIGAGTGFSAEHMDLTGLWYLKWDPSDNVLVSAYRQLRMEIAVTFADASVEGWQGPDKPFKIKHPGQWPRHWAYSDTIASEGQMFGHSISWEICHNLTYSMDNVTHGYIEGIGPFNKINEDQWSRPTTLSSGHTFTYKLSRIIRADGTTTEHYADYEALMKDNKVRVWGRWNQEKRCKATALFNALCWAYSFDVATCAP